MNHYDRDALVVHRQAFDRNEPGGGRPLQIVRLPNMDRFKVLNLFGE
jgi:hypothetical protein